MADASDGNERYFGYLVPRTDEEQEPCRIRVETSGFLGRPKVVRRLERNEDDGPFNWGYHGSGPHATAAAVLADVLGEPVCSFKGPHQRMAREFAADVISHFPQGHKWTLGSVAVIGWVRGWLVGSGADRSLSGLNGLGVADAVSSEPNEHS